MNRSNGQQISCGTWLAAHKSLQNEFLKSSTFFFFLKHFINCLLLLDGLSKRLIWHSVKVFQGLQWGSVKVHNIKIMQPNTSKELFLNKLCYKKKKKIDVNVFLICIESGKIKLYKLMDYQK